MTLNSKPYSSETMSREKARRHLQESPTIPGYRRTVPALDERVVEERSMERTDPVAALVRTVPLVEKYWHLVYVGLLKEEQLHAAVRAADRAGVDLEEVLMQSYRIDLPQIGEALSKYFGCPYEPYLVERPRPETLFASHPKYDYLLREGYLPLRELPDG